MCLIFLIMKWYLVVTYLSLAVCIISCSYHVIRIIRLGRPHDFSKSAGDVGSAIRYSFTTAMKPSRKESAYLHLPTYTAGILYHLGTFLSIILFFIFLLNIELYRILVLLCSGFLALSICCGIGILFKRIFSDVLKEISYPDDYISNFLVTTFQLGTLLYMHFSLPLYYVVVSVMLLYIPLGKLKHTLYFFAARYHLGLFYGRRGTWPR
jgi:nitrate reductase gamma subunit